MSPDLASVIIYIHKYLFTTYHISHLSSVSIEYYIMVTMGGDNDEKALAEERLQDMLDCLGASPKSPEILSIQAWDQVTPAWTRAAQRTPGMPSGGQGSRNKTLPLINSYA